MKLFLFIICLSAHAVLASQDFNAYEKHYFNAPLLNMPYLYMRPLHAEPLKKYPLLIFLHGANQRGFDNERPLLIGGAFFSRDSIRNKYNSYILFPQCPEIDTWAYFETTSDPQTGKVTALNFPFKKQPTEVSQVLMQLLDSLVKSDAIDPDRIYIAGLSQGGMGVLDLIARYPDRFAAGVSMCGAGNVTTTKLFAQKVPLWLFHGEKDDIIPVDFSRSYYKRLTRLHADVQYTEYLNVLHNCWINAFKTAEWVDWMYHWHKS
jgi:predicted peptidase